MKTKYLTLLFALIIAIPATSQERMAKLSKSEKRQAAYERTKSLIESGEFVFEALWAFPQSGQAVNVIGDNNRFEVKDGTATGSMQYFGTAYTARINLRNQGLVMDGPIENWRIITNDKRQKLAARFMTSKKREVYDMEISIAAGGSAVVIVSSSLRDPMRYEGYVRPIAVE